MDDSETVGHHRSDRMGRAGGSCAKLKITLLLSAFEEIGLLAWVRWLSPISLIYPRKVPYIPPYSTVKGPHKGLGPRLPSWSLTPSTSISLCVLHFRHPSGTSRVRAAQTVSGHITHCYSYCCLHYTSYAHSREYTKTKPQQPRTRYIPLLPFLPERAKSQRIVTFMDQF